MGVVFKKNEVPSLLAKTSLIRKKGNHCYWMCVLKKGSIAPSLVKMYLIIQIWYFLVEAKVFSIR
jgi:hypothetical protein